MGKRWWLKKKKELGLIPDDDAGKPSMFDGFGFYTLFPWLRRPKKDPNAGEYIVQVTSFRTQRACRGTTALRFLLITRHFSLIVSIYGPSLVIRLTFVFRLALSAHSTT